MKTQLLILFLLCVQISFAQKKKQKCKLVFDKELGIEVYNDIDSISGKPEDETEDDFSFIKNFNYKAISKKYPIDQRVQFAYMANTDGSNSLIKVLIPKDDKEIEAEVKKLVEKIPRSKRSCYCNGQVIPCHGSINMRLYPKTKCKQEFDKELGITVYKDIDTAAMPVDETKFNEFFNAEVFKDLKLSKKYPDDQMVQIAFMIGVDGKASLIKVLEPKNDKEITAEAQIIVNFIPLHKPCKCGEVAVPCNGNISFPLYSKKK